MVPDTVAKVGQVWEYDRTWPGRRMRVVAVTEVRVLLVTIRDGRNAKVSKVGKVRSFQHRNFPDHGMRLLDNLAKDP